MLGGSNRFTVGVARPASHLPGRHSALLHQILSPNV